MTRIKSPSRSLAGIMAVLYARRPRLQVSGGKIVACRHALQTQDDDSTLDGAKEGRVNCAAESPAMFELCYETHFSASHQDRSATDPRRSYRGHNWRVEVFVRGAELVENGMVMDFARV